MLDNIPKLVSTRIWTPTSSADAVIAGHPENPGLLGLSVISISVLLGIDSHQAILFIAVLIEITVHTEFNIIGISNESQFSLCCTGKVIPLSL